MRDKFRDAHHQYDNVFNPDFPKYNGASCDIYAKVNMGKSLPPQRKGRLPSYNKEKLVELQQKFDELEAYGVFAKPEDINVTVEYLNLSFLVAKPSGGTRLVTFLVSLHVTVSLHHLLCQMLMEYCMILPDGSISSSQIFYNLSTRFPSSTAPCAFVG